MIQKNPLSLTISTLPDHHHHHTHHWHHHHHHHPHLDQDDDDDKQARGLSERYLEEILRAAALHGYVQFCSPSICHSFIFTNTNTKTLNPLLAIVWFLGKLCHLCNWYFLNLKISDFDIFHSFLVKRIWWELPPGENDEKKTRSWDSGVPGLEGEAFALSKEMEEVFFLALFSTMHLVVSNVSSNWL